VTARLVLLACVVFAAPLLAQAAPSGAAIKGAASKAAGSTGTATKGAGTKGAPTNTAAQQSKAATPDAKAKAPVQGRVGQRPETVVEAPPVIMREDFDYDAEGRRDPFVSLLVTTDLRPTLQELRLVSILYDETGRRPIAVMRDGSNTQYRVTTGMTLGRMRIALITRRAVIVNIEEFGLNRTDSLVLGTTNRNERRQ
jgi:hypothetical protein